MTDKFQATNPPKKIRLAIVGCGAIAELGHLPAAMACPSVEVTMLVDHNQLRAEQMAHTFQVPRVQTDLKALEKWADAAIIATPPGMHAALAIELMERGMHILVEKPLANTAEECEQMAKAANRTGRVLAVGMVRRFYWADRYVNDLLMNGALGPVLSFSSENGYPFEWPSASRFILSKSEAGGGVLMGLGSHVLDTLFWCLGEPADFQFYGDARGGIEADCRLELKMKSGASGTVELSRTRKLDNRHVINCEHGRIVAPFLGNAVEIVTAQGHLRLAGIVTPESSGQNRAGVLTSDGQPMADQLQDFLDAIWLGREPMATVQQAIKSIRFIEDCYARMQPWPQTWEQPIQIPEEVGL
jgi:predicted dehydrogenase